MNVNETVWSDEFGCYVSRAFAPKNSRNLKLDINKCIIKITIFGFYELWLKENKLRNLDFNEFMKYKKYVKEVIEEAHKYE